jgi:hypothetical protein
VQEKKLHIVCHDVPYPPDHGGVFDLFYKIRTLHEAGVRILLHCFEYGRGEQPALNSYCEQVYYYPRRTGHKGFSHRLPYIVCSRSSPELLERLLEDDFPILLEGVHCTYLLNDERFAGRKVFIRLHNMESVYYRQLAGCTASPFKKLYYLHESSALKKYEQQIASRWPLLAVSQSDAEAARTVYQAREVCVIPVFLPYEKVDAPQGTGCYCLYHGNLAVEENEEAACWLLEHVFRELKLPFLIAGKQPSSRLRRIAGRFPHACIIPDPSDPELQDIIAKAQLHLIPSFNCTGIKLKLLNALYNGRHCIVNEQAVAGSGLADLCHVAATAGQFRTMVEDLYEKPFTQMELEFRREKLLKQYDNRLSADRLIERIW